MCGQVLFAAELRRRLPLDSRLAVLAVNPGEALTNIVRDNWLATAYQLVLKPILVTPAQGPVLAPLSCASLLIPSRLICEIGAPRCFAYIHSCLMVHLCLHLYLSMASCECRDAAA